MTVPVQLGPRASLLLGLLSAGTYTIAEMHAIVGRAAEQAAPIADALLGAEAGDVAASLVDLHAGGEDELERLLARLERFGYAVSVLYDEARGGALWTIRRV